jgi:organic hydroperoxide reductase OsmC/OhrA
VDDVPVSIVKTHLHTATATVPASGSAVVESRAGKRLAVGLPPEFRGGLEDAWSGEELLVAAAASSFAATLAALAERKGISVGELTVAGSCLVERRDSGRYEVVALELEVRVTGRVADRVLRALAEDARERTVVASALAVPLHVRLTGSNPAGGGVRGPGPRHEHSVAEAGTA